MNVNIKRGSAILYYRPALIESPSAITYEGQRVLVLQATFHATHNDQARVSITSGGKLHSIATINEDQIIAHRAGGLWVINNRPFWDVLQTLKGTDNVACRMDVYA